jgi:hypothetical protein
VPAVSDSCDVPVRRRLLTLWRENRYDFPQILLQMCQVLGLLPDVRGRTVTRVCRSLIRLLILTICSLSFLVTCTDIYADEEWLDNPLGGYRCPGCRDNGLLWVVGVCARCGCGTSSISYKYCYECAKKLDRCQLCGIPRRFVELIP